uniref:G-protein coupled receptors family 1 profile domain-containing protein n=2 Tax=Caenorhabditis japonica TaxID=281687 RepID=A0A8R1HU53_CAEJA
MNTSLTSSSSDGEEETFMSISSILATIETSGSLRWLRKNSRHLVPIFCVVGILGNSMALILISDFICVWMISLISCDRMIVLFRPRVRKWVCTKTFSRNMTIGTVVTSTVLYSWVFLFAGMETVKYKGEVVTKYCGLSQDVNLFGYQVTQHYFMFTLMDTALCTLLPAILIIIVNSFSTYRYRQCMKIYSSGVLRVRFVRAPNTRQQQEQLNNDTIQFVSFLKIFGEF